MGSSMSASFSAAVGDAPTGSRARYDPLSALAALEAPARGPPPRADFLRQLVLSAAEVAEERRRQAEERRRKRSQGGGGSSPSMPRGRNKYDPIQYELDPQRKPDFFD